MSFWLGAVKILSVAIVLDQLTHPEERGVVRDARGLLHVVRHDHDGVGLLELVDQLLDALRRDGSSADAGSSISSTFGRTASARAMHSRCCWPPDSASADSCSRSFTSSQSAAAADSPRRAPASSARDAGQAVRCAAP